MSMPNSIRLGTRTSPLAMVQTRMVADALRAAHHGIEIDIVEIKSAADWQKGQAEKSLCSDEGGKGLFAKEIERALMEGEIDMGVHSAKDMPSFLPEGLEISHFLPRHDARELFICEAANKLSDLPSGATLGTCSPRRAAMTLYQRPDINIVPFRGNIETRLEKVKNGQVDATYLACAGVERLGIKSDMTHEMEVEEILPACGQGAVCLEVKESNMQLKKLLDDIACTHTNFCVSAEREVLKILDGSCHTPIAAYAVIEDDQIWLRAQVCALDGSELFEESLSAPCTHIEDAISVGQRVGKALKKKVPANILLS